jgi:hypothetical protein
MRQYRAQGFGRPLPSRLCRSLPDEGDRHVVGFEIPDVHLFKIYGDGRYRITPTLTGNWSEPSIQILHGFRLIVPPDIQLKLRRMLQSVQ